MTGTLASRPRIVWLLAFAAFFLASGAWSFAVPYNAFPDEVQHVVRAAGVVQGQILQPPAILNRATGAYQTVPAGLSPGGQTLSLGWRCDPDELRAFCGPAPGAGGSRPVTVLTGAGRYNPVYYLLIGEPLEHWPDWLGVLAARLITAALASALLASALLSCLQWPGAPLLAGGFVVAATPKVLYQAGSINPSAIEITAGIGLAAALFPLLLGPANPHAAGLIRRAGIAGVILAMPKATGPLFVVVLLAVAFIPRPRVWRHRAARWWLGGVAASCALSAAWTAIAHSGALGQYGDGNGSPAHNLAYTIFGALPGTLRGTVEGFPYGADFSIVLIAWAMALGALVMPALAVGTTAQRCRVTALLAVTLSMPLAFGALAANELGFTFQGRYLLPIACGVPLLAACAIADSGCLTPAVQRSAVRLLTGCLLPLQMFCLIYQMDRYQNGLGVGIPFDPLLGSWHPYLGSCLPLAMMTAGLIILGLLIDRATMPGPPEPGNQTHAPALMAAAR
jgi:Predicted membrane protein (DUF2142)